MGLSHSSTDLATLPNTAHFSSFERSTSETDAERTKLTQPEQDPTRTTGKPAEGSETPENPKHSESNERLRTCLETYKANTMHPYWAGLLFECKPTFFQLQRLFYDCNDCKTTFSRLSESFFFLTAVRRLSTVATARLVFDC